MEEVPIINVIYTAWGVEVGGGLHSVWQIRFACGGWSVYWSFLSRRLVQEAERRDKVVLFSWALY